VDEDEPRPESAESGVPGREPASGEQSPELGEPGPGPGPGPGAGSRLAAWVREHPWVAGTGVLVVAAAAWLTTRPGGGPGEEGPSVGHTVSTFFQAQRDEDCRRLVDLLTEASWSQDGELSRGEFLEQCADAVDGYREAAYEPRLRAPGASFHVEIVGGDGDRSSEGDRAVVRFESFTADEEWWYDLEGRLVREDGEWKVETDPYVLPIGRSIEDTVRGFVDAYDEGDCERLLDHLSRPTWSQDGQVDRQEFLEACRRAADDRRELGQPPVSVAQVEMPDPPNDDQVTVEATLSLTGGLAASPSTSVTLVREGLEWTLDVGQLPRRGGAGTPFLTLDLAELQTRLVDETGLPEGPCFDYGERRVQDGQSGGAERGIRREFACEGTDPSVTLYRYADDAEAGEAADRLAAEIVQDPPPTPEETGMGGIITDPAELATYVADFRPNQAVAVPGMPEARGVLSFCRVDGCSTAVAFAVRNGVVVEARLPAPAAEADIGKAATVLQAQLERL
jgi:hypothetical protein